MERFLDILSSESLDREELRCGSPHSSAVRDRLQTHSLLAAADAAACVPETRHLEASAELSSFEVPRRG
jgi:hypothetical protein